MLPVPVTPFIGRAAERAALAGALAEHRLVTAIGPGGIGKSRLAISVAADVAAVRRDGCWFVDLVRVTDPAAVVGAVAEAVGVVRSSGRRRRTPRWSRRWLAATDCSCWTTASICSTAFATASSRS